jgi:hypothetical protein
MPDRPNSEADRPHERDQQGRWKATEPDAVLEIRMVDGEEGERLARQQATRPMRANRFAPLRYQQT